MAGVRILLYPLLRPGQIGSYAPALDITGDCEESLPTLRQRLDRDGWSYGVSVVEDIDIRVFHQGGRFFRAHTNSVFIHGGRENSKLEIYHGDDLHFVGFLNDRYSEDDPVKRNSRLKFTGRLGLLQKTGIGRDLFVPGECFEDALRKCFEPSGLVRDVLGEVNIAKLDDFTADPLIVRSSAPLRDDQNILKALASLLSVVDGAAIEKPGGIDVARRQRQGASKLTITNDILTRRGAVNVAQTRLVARLDLVLSDSLKLVRVNEDCALAYGETPVRSLNVRWLASEAEPLRGISQAEDIASFLFRRFCAPQEDISVTLQGVHQLSLLDAVALELYPQVDEGKKRRLDSGIPLDGTFPLPAAGEVGVYGAGYIVERVVDFRRELTTIKVRFGAGA